jgi:hypothetical protein
MTWLPWPRRRSSEAGTEAGGAGATQAEAPAQAHGSAAASQLPTQAGNADRPAVPDAGAGATPATPQQQHQHQHQHQQQQQHNPQALPGQQKQPGPQPGPGTSGSKQGGAASDCGYGDCFMQLVHEKEYCKADFGAFDACFDAVEAGTKKEEECMPLVRVWAPAGPGRAGPAAAWLLANRCRPAAAAGASVDDSI